MRNVVAPPIGRRMFWTLPNVTSPLGNELHTFSEKEIGRQPCTLGI